MPRIFKMNKFLRLQNDTLMTWRITLPSAHVDVEAKKRTTNMDVHLVKTSKFSLTIQDPLVGERSCLLDLSSSNYDVDWKFPKIACFYCSIDFIINHHHHHHHHHHHNHNHHHKQNPNIPNSKPQCVRQIASPSFSEYPSLLLLSLL